MTDMNLNARAYPHNKRSLHHRRFGRGREYYCDFVSEVAKYRSLDRQL